MDRGLFISRFAITKPGLDMSNIDNIISACLDRCHDKYPEYPRGHMNLVTTMEESAELVEAISQRMRGRTSDNYDILQEMADVIMAIWCVAQIYDISHEDIQKAINVKIGQEIERIMDHANGLKTQ